MHLKHIEYIKPNNISIYPFNIPLFKNFHRLDFKTPVTIFVGENGTGKSTLLEGIAAGIGSITIGQDSIDYDKSLKAARDLSRNLKLSWKKKLKKVFSLERKILYLIPKR